jgi:hypothetical protein
VESGGVVFSWAFSTSGDAQMLAAGDIADCSNSNDSATAALLDQYPSATVQTLGDNAYPSGSLADFNNCYQPTWGRAKARTRPAVGNEEYATQAASGYFGYFGSAAGTPGQGWYSYNLGRWHVVVLNTECPEVGGCGASSAQGQWLEADLSRNSATCTLAVLHRPLFTAGGVGPFADARPLWEILYRHGADLVLSGHSHAYERFSPQTPAGAANSSYGVREIVVGTGGGETLGSFVTSAPNTQVRNNTAFGVLLLTLKSSSYDYRFLSASGGTFSDSGSGSCHGAPPS